MKSKRFFKSFIWGIIILLLVCVSMMGIDYWRTVCAFKKPIFAICMSSCDDGGSGTYTGIGYSIDIKGNFMPLDEFPGVTHAKFYVFRTKITQCIRD